MSPILGEHLLSSMTFFGLCGLPAGSLLSLGMEATRQGWYLTTAQRHRLGPSLGHAQKLSRLSQAFWKGCSEEISACLMVLVQHNDLKGVHGGSSGPHLSFLTPGFYAQWSQTHLAARPPRHRLAEM